MTEEKLQPLEARLTEAEAFIDTFKQFSNTQMQATPGIYKQLEKLTEQLTSMQKDIALIKESLVALSSNRH